MKKNVLVTGADGFIGSHLVELLYKNNFKVRALCQYNSFGSWGWLDNVDIKNDIEIILGDIRDPILMKSITKDIDIVFHLAALIAIPYSYQAPYSYIQTNVEGTLNLLQASLENNISHFLHTSTSEVYGTAKYVPIDETHPLQPQSPYSASKISADSIALSYYHSFDFPVTIVRPFNTYGPRQSLRAVIPSVICQILEGATKINIGDTTPTRDFNFVEDTVLGFMKIAENKKSVLGEVINIATQEEISIKELILLISKIMNSPIELKNDPNRHRPKNSEVFRLLGDNTKIKSLTNYQHQHSLEQGLIKTINWLQENIGSSNYKSHLYNV